MLLYNYLYKTAKFTVAMVLQSFGAKQYSNLGIYLQRALLVSAAASVLVVVLWMQLDPLLTLLGKTCICFLMYCWCMACHHMLLLAS